MDSPADSPAGACPTRAQAGTPPTIGGVHDLVIRNGNVVDGTGGPMRVADVAIDGDVIGDGVHRRGRGWARSACPHRHQPAQVARRRVRPGHVRRAMLAHDGHGMLYVPLFNYSSGDLPMLHELHRHPSTRMGLSDAGAHCGSICDGGIPTFMLTHWTRDRTRGLPSGLEHMMHRQTAQTASLFGLRDSGVLAPGMKADVNVIDYANLRFGNARMAYDFPANARRLVQGAKGYVATVCSGTVIVEHDSFTGAMPGRLIRGPQPGLRPGSPSGLR